MNQDFNTKLIDTFCSICGYEEPRFLHRFWNGGGPRYFCTSCVLLSHKQAFCPSCLDVYDPTLPDIAICCNQCHSYSHATCLSSNGSPLKAPYLCLSCINPDRIILNLRELKAKGEDEGYVMDRKALKTFLTAAKIAEMSMTRAAKASLISADMIVEETVIAEKKAAGAVNHVVELEDQESNCHVVVATGNNNDVAWLVDSWIHSEEDSSPETLRESGRLQRLTVEGAISEAQSSRVAMDIDLNEEYPSWKDD